MNARNRLRFGNPRRFDLVTRLLRNAQHLVFGIANVILPPRGSHRLEPQRQAGELIVNQSTITAKRQELVPLSIRIQNRGRDRWFSTGDRPVRLFLEWKTRSGGNLSDRPHFELPLRADVAPGESIKAQLCVRALHAIGEYRLEIQIGQSGETIFPIAAGCVNITINDPAGKWGLSPHVATRGVTSDVALLPTLDSEVTKTKLKLLIDAGLTPDSKILEIGSGKGQLAVLLGEFLSDRGEYSGSELGAADVHLTAIPLTGKAFDFIVVLDLFTHTYPDEIRSLLLDSRRLLAPNGGIYAEFLTSPVVSHYLGNRDAIVHNHERLIALFGEVGLRCEAVVSAPWQQYARRRFLKLTPM